MRFLSTAIILVLMLLANMCAAPALALDLSHTYAQPQYLSPLLLPSPPIESGDAWRKQAEGVIRAQKNLAPSELVAIKDEQKMRVELMTPILGASFTRDKLPKTFAFLDGVLENTGQISEADKKFWHTRRPYLTNKNVKLYVDPIDASPSYPSGHTTSSHVLAEVLGMLKPDQLAALRARADTIAQHRIEAGVHYPVDIEGGRALAMLIIGAMVSNDYFQDDLAVARKEIDAR